MTRKVPSNEPINDFLNTDFPAEDAPQLPAPELPFFQFHSDEAVFEFALTRTEDDGRGQKVEVPLWSAILGDAGLPVQQMKHQKGRVKSPAYVFPKIHFCVLGEHVYWFDDKAQNSPLFKDRPNSLPVGSRYISKRLIVGLVKEVEQLAPGTLCFLTAKSTASKNLGLAMWDFDEKVLLPAHKLRLAKIRESNPTYQEPPHMLFPRYAFWMPLEAGEPKNVSPAGQEASFVPPIVGGWNVQGESPERLRELFISPVLQAKIRDEYLPLARRWLVTQEARWVVGNGGEAPAVDIESEPDGEESPAGAE